VATHSGNRFTLQTHSGRAVPTNRAQGPVFPAAVFEAVGATSSIRTVRHYSDAAMRVRQVISLALERQAHTGQLVVHQLESDFDVGQTIFAVLINESHEIQT